MNFGSGRVFFWHAFCEIDCQWAFGVFMIILFWSRFVDDFWVGEAKVMP